MTDKNDENDAGGPSELQKATSSYRKGWMYAEIAFQYGAAIVICALAGYWLDKYLDTNVLFTVIGVFLGAAAGFIGLLRTLKVVDFKRKGELKKKD
ncbi:MAG: AtpZ/AtpI family protein [Ignavibacteria bacterium]